MVLWISVETRCWIVFSRTFRNLTDFLSTCCAEKWDSEHLPAAWGYLFGLQQPDTPSLPRLMECDPMCSQRCMQQKTQGNPYADLWISFSASFFPGLWPANCHHLSRPDLNYLSPDFSDTATLCLDSPSTCCCPASAPMLEGRVPQGLPGLSLLSATPVSCVWTAVSCT